MLSIAAAGRIVRSVVSRSHSGRPGVSALRWGLKKGSQAGRREVTEERPDRTVTNRKREQKAYQ